MLGTPFPGWHKVPLHTYVAFLTQSHLADLAGIGTDWSFRPDTHVSWYPRLWDARGAKESKVVVYSFWQVGNTLLAHRNPHGYSFPFSLLSPVR